MFQFHPGSLCSKSESINIIPQALPQNKAKGQAEKVLSKNTNTFLETNGEI